jgi:hypothetical protein
MVRLGRMPKELERLVVVLAGACEPSITEHDICIRRYVYGVLPASSPYQSVRELEHYPFLQKESL